MNAGLSARFARWKGSLVAFAVGQPAVQLLNVLTGFFLLRWLSKEEFAMFGVAFAFQSTVNQLTDLGFSGSVVALAGERGTEPAWLGRYLRAARHYRARLLAFTLLGAAVAFPLLVAPHGWGWRNNLLLFGAVALAVVAQGWMLYGSPLLVHRRLADYYRPQIVGAAARLTLCLGLFAVGWLSGWVVAWIGALVVALTGYSFRCVSRGFVSEPVQTDPEAGREMRRYLSPLLPTAVFAALQGQITIGLITVFGTTDKIAEVSALGRIGQLFLIFNSFNAVLIAPYIARLPEHLLVRRYAQILAANAVVAGAIAAGGFLLPAPLLWLLGPKYAGLEREVGWLVGASCVSYLAGVLWTMNSARKWIFWWSTATEIIGLVLVQAACAVWLDLSRTIAVIWFGGATALLCLAVHTATAVYGLQTRTNRHNQPGIIGKQT